MTNDTNTFSLQRIFNAPLDLVWRAFSTAEHLGSWWGPKEADVTVISFDFKEGGFFHYKMQMPEGASMYGRFTFEEISPKHTIIWRNAFADENGNIVRAPFSDLIPLEIRNSVTLTEEGGKTTLKLMSAPVDAPQDEIDFFWGIRNSMQQGFTGTFDQLELYLQDLS